MSLKINGLDGSQSIPHIVSHTYKFTKFEKSLEVKVNGTTQTILVRDTIMAAWKLVIYRAKGHNCNHYFKTLARGKNLGRGKTLQNILDGPDIILHLLEPLKDHDYSELPAANCAGQDIGLHPDLLLVHPELKKEHKDDPHIGLHPDLLLVHPELKKEHKYDPHSLACTLIHELAHTAGASTNSNKDDPRSHEAEDALQHCQCKDYFSKDNLGLIQPLEFRKSGGSRIA